ncbi:MAG: hypothetical protein E1N59_1626 [Puniceicoccaceae bacterium 5H]|nr:MAG: hypothetical protein E1N59_1626 [Puniceicoccaceae bacterium 5H]
MKKRTLLKLQMLFGLLCGSFLLTACDNGAGGSAELSDTDVVPSGTYTGIAQEVDPEEKEIYVHTADDKTLELYFTDQTQLMQNGQNVQFSALEPNQRVEVEVEKKGQRLEPITVTILGSGSSNNQG